jgi:hypothetical protein
MSYGKSVTLALTAMVLCLSSQAGYGLVNYTNHPDLAKAMEYDAEAEGCVTGKADRAVAERYYLKYLKDVNDSFQRAHVYCRLGVLYSVVSSPDKGEEPNDVKAIYYYRKVLEAEPERISLTTMTARSMLVALDHKPGMDHIKAAMDFYRWLQSWDEAKVRRWWLPLRPAEGPGDSDIRATMLALTRYKECDVTHAAEDALSQPVPEEGVAYICGQLPTGSPELKLVYEMLQEHAKALASGAILNRAASSLPRPSYEIDPSLREAWRQYLDTKGRDREAVRSLFEAYLAREPNSPFKAEVYYLMGSLYSNNIIPELGEKMDLPLARKFYGKAHELYGSKWTPQAEGAYWLLISSPGTLVDRKAYYEWLTKLAKAGTPEDMYPIRTIDQCIAHNAPPEDDLAGRTARLKWMQNKYIQDRIKSTEKEMLRYASWGDDRHEKLLDLATSYPGTELAKQARKAMEDASADVGKP